MQIQKCLGITLVALMGAATMVSAQSDSNASEIEKWGRLVYVAPMATFTLDDHDRATRNGYGASLAVGTRLFSWLAVEGYGAYTGYTDDSKLTGDASTKALSVGANLLAFPLSGNFKNAYVLAGAGYHDVKDQPSATGGGTFAFRITTRRSMTSASASSTAWKCSTRRMPCASKPSTATTTTVIAAWVSTTPASLKNWRSAPV